jgi:hypothetical protein
MSSVMLVGRLGRGLGAGAEYRLRVPPSMFRQTIATMTKPIVAIRACRGFDIVTPVC